ncbi:MAG: adenosylmethionine decarboxylase [Spirochaetia bacterium]|nr:adenosylmethionine decarboxylase [Spirochaetia bacterium]
MIKTDTLTNVSEKQKPYNEKGIHILAEFYDCKSGRNEMLQADRLEIFCHEKVKDVELTEVGRIFYQFPESGVTGTILLAESHVAIHTWPEKDYLSLDIFVCNVTCDNSEKARKLYDYFANLFQPEKVNYQEVERE